MFGHKILFAYDVGCTFSATLSNSSIGELAHNFNFKSCTGSFHGAAHNQLCQLSFHIGLMDGAGIEDGEGNKRLYYSSNALMSVMFHLMAYYYHLQMHIHFEKWDQDKHECLGQSLFIVWYEISDSIFHIIPGKFLIDNHSSAILLIKKSLDTLKTTWHIQPTFNPDCNCPQWLQQEKDYIKSLWVKPKWEYKQIEYLEANEHLEHTL